MSTLDQADVAPPVADAAVLRPLAALLVQVADRRRERAAKQLDSVLSQLAAGGGRVGRWAEALRKDGEGTGAAVAGSGEKGVNHAG